MKSLLITLLILGSLFLAYDALLTPPHQRVIFPKGPAPVVKSTPPPSPAQTPSPPPTTTSTPPAPTSTPTKPATNDFVPPAIASLEEATQNWTAIPERAFPRNVLLRQPVSIKMTAGTGQLAAGTSALALAANQGVLTIAPAAASTARGQIPITDTDFPDQIRSAYEAWKTHRIQIARESWEARQKAPATIASTNLFDPAGKPLTNSSGKYDLILESMRIGQVTEVRPDNIRSWGTAHPGPVDGKPGWLIEIDFTATTLFGKFDTQAQAQILNGKLHRWIYTGSGEEVP